SDEEEANSAANGGHRLPRSPVPERAKQARCKVRSEVVELTRDMVDRTSANFLLFPPCVEVQRCSGCCTSRDIQCVSNSTSTRNLTVTKIVFNERPTYSKVVVSVVDHVDCRCQPTPRPAVLKNKETATKLFYSAVKVTVRSKDELHQLDELKPNQRPHLGHRWDPRGDAFPQPGEGYSLAGEDASRSEEAVLFPSHWDQNFPRFLETEEQTELQENVGTKNDEVSKDNAGPPADNVDVEGKMKMGEDRFDSTEGNPKAGHKHTQTHSPLGLDDKSKPFKSHSVGLSEGVAENSQAMLNPSEETFIERARGRVRSTKEPNPEPREPAGRRANETPDVERMSQIAEEKLEAERKELLLLHKRLDEEKELLQQQKMKQEEEERLNERETDSQHRKHHHLHTTEPKPGKRNRTTSSTTTMQKAPAPTGPRLPVRPNPQRRRMKKNRKLISKAAMRAMLM
uniref:Platelet-derived growth factor subunit B n=1 Tax=Poecilia latipinna TaxID=48699 RepID=A0A3B3VVG6_9TELE